MFILLKVGLALVMKVVRLFVGTRNQGSGSYVASVPLLQLRKLAVAPDKSRRWSFVDGWLILEAF